MATTGHYDRVEKEDRELFVANSYGRYRVSDLSTGAREQVLLGLRIGFAAIILAGTPLFLILDDAFQHSDWERRDRLVKKLFALAKEGWQIIYFTMDDHIPRAVRVQCKGSWQGPVPDYYAALIEDLSAYGRDGLEEARQLK